MDDLEEKYMKVSDFAFVGNLHNTVMTKVNDGIPSEKIVSESSTKEEAVDAVATFIDVEMNKCTGHRTKRIRVGTVKNGERLCLSKSYA